MASKARKKSAAKAKKKKRPAASARKNRKSAAKKTAARKKTARKAKPKGVVATIVGDFNAVLDAVVDAERLHRKLEPPGSPELED